MTACIQLKEVRFSNFRSFGEDCSIPLQPGPSVLVVAGPNGLGKTTLIEGIEWALTGRIRRFRQDEDKVNRALTRWGAKPGSHQVRLTFDEGQPITRGPHSTPALSDVLEVLGDPGWPHKIEDLAAYLGLTHILSQSPTLRLTSRDPQERWKDLSELTGAVRIDRMLERLGQGTKRRMTTGAKDAADRRERLEATRARLLNLLTELREHDALLSADAAYPAEQARAEGSILAQRLTSAIGVEVEWHDDAAIALSALFAAVEQGRMALAARRTALERVTHQVGLWTAGVAEAARVDRAVANVAALHRAVGAVYDAKLRLEQWDKRRSLLAQQPAANAAVEAAADRLEQHRRAVEDAAAAKWALEDLNTRLAKADEAVRIEEGVLASWRALAEEEQAVGAALRGVAEEEEARGRAQDALRAVEEHHKALEQTHGDAELALVEVEAARKVAAANVAEKASHLSALIKDLHEGDTECPLCLAVHENGELLARARQALERQDPGLTEATARVASARERVKACLEAVTAHAAACKAASDNVRPFEERRIEAEARADALRHRPEIAGRSLEGLAGWIAGRIAAAEADVARLRAELRALDPEETLAERRHRAAQAVASAEDALATAEKEHDDAKARAAAIQNGALFAVRDSLELNPIAVDAAVAEARAALARTEAVLDEAERAVDAAVRAAPEGTPLVQWTKSNLDALGRERDEIAGRQKLCLQIWKEAGLPGEPAAGIVAEALARIAATVDEVDAIDERGRVLKAGYERWLADQRRQDLQKQIDALTAGEGTTDAASYLALLDRRIAEAERDTERWTRARRISEWVGAIIDAKQEAFITTIVDPLRDRADGFDGAWSSFPDRRPDMMHSRARRGSKGVFTITINGSDADLCLSEGQASVKALSFLLAASTAHPWSRWRALLLDDPLQYNDLVHKAAFLDMLRPLVRAKAYQVILSTHDLEEARFIERKCRNAGIAFNLCRLHADGKNGVAYSIS